MVTGCKVGPDFHSPESSAPAGWNQPSTQPTTRTAATAGLATWWSTFNDPRLDSLIARALAENLDLKLAESRIVQARAALAGQASSLWPFVGTQTGAQRSRSAAPAAGERSLFQAGLDASWELDLFGGIKRGVEAADADIQAAVEDRRDVRVTMISEIGLNYISLRSSQRQIAISRKNYVAQEDTAAVTRKKLAGGIANRLDVVNAEAESATTLANIPLLESSARQSIYNLALLLGQTPGDIEAELLQPEPDPCNLAEIPAGLPSELLRRRPDIRRAEAQLHAATARVGVATADLFPKFSLTGSFGFQSGELRSLANYDQRAWSIGPAVSWPLFDAGQIRANIDVQSALQEQALLNYRKTVLTAIHDAQMALATCAAEHDRRQALLAALAANGEAVRLARRRYEGGEAEFLDVLIAQRSLYASQLSLAGSDATLASGLVSLYKALGGGWDPAGSDRRGPATQPVP
ncbi:MAG: efflux transporter outer membrane subunit [Tepidisphaerales bacterium]